MIRFKHVFLGSIALAVGLALYSSNIGRQKNPDWPFTAAWHQLRQAVGGRLIAPLPPKTLCQDPTSDSCIQLETILNNPILMQEYSWATQSSGWLSAWKTSVSPYAVAVQKKEDIVAAVQFAHKHNLRVVIKGAGHDYLGRSNAPDSLLIWTRPMRKVELVDRFVAEGAPKGTQEVSAVQVEAGARWGEVYQAVTTKRKRYVQGGGCTTVGAAGGFLQGGGFGSWSKRYGTAGAYLLQAEVVLASGEHIVVNEHQYPDLFWALKGGGGGTFGVVTQVVLQTHELPSSVGVVQGQISAETDQAFQRLLEQFVSHYHQQLNNTYWGEQVTIQPANTLDVAMVWQGQSVLQAHEAWQPLLDWADSQPDVHHDLQFSSIPSDKIWDLDYWQEVEPAFIRVVSREGQESFYWASNQAEVSAFWHSYHSRWIPEKLFAEDQAKGLAETLFSASRHWPIGLHFNKGLAGATEETLQKVGDTPMHPVALEAAALAIVAAAEKGTYPNLSPYEPNIEQAKQQKVKVETAIDVIIQATPNSGSYGNESDYFLQNWQQQIWGSHYPRLLEIKRKYDPKGFFKGHHTVGSEL